MARIDELGLECQNVLFCLTGRWLTMLRHDLHVDYRTRAVITDVDVNHSDESAVVIAVRIENADQDHPGLPSHPILVVAPPGADLVPQQADSGDERQRREQCA